MYVGEGSKNLPMKTTVPTRIQQTWIPYSVEVSLLQVVTGRGEGEHDPTFITYTVWLPYSV